MGVHVDLLLGDDLMALACGRRRHGERHRAALQLRCVLGDDGQSARVEAETRLRSLPIVAQALVPPDTPIGVEPDEFTDETHLRVIVRAAPLTVTPSFAQWALSRAPESLHRSALGMLPNTGIHDHGVAEVEPQGRGVVVKRVSGYPGRAYLTIVADAGGVIGTSLARTQVGSDMTATNIINETFLRPLIDLVADRVQEAEALGSAAWDVWILLPDGLDLHQAERMPPRRLRMGGQMTIPADTGERIGLATRWERELRREAGMAASWEPSGQFRRAYEVLRATSAWAGERSRTDSNHGPDQEPHRQRPACSDSAASADAGGRPGTVTEHSSVLIRPHNCGTLPPIEGQSRKVLIRMKRAEALEALLEAANEQGGYVSGPQAKRLGVGRKDIDRLVAVGDLQRVRRGVYRMRHAQSRFEDEVAAWLHLQRDVLPWERRDEPRAVLSHESAAGFHRLGTIIPGRPTFTALRGPRTTAADDLVLHHMQIPDQDWTWERDETLRLPVTTPARTIVDLMLAREEPSYIVRATREALARGQTTPEELRDTAHHRKSNSRAVEGRVARLLEEIT